MTAAGGMRLAWRVLRAEGASALRDRLLDRLAARRRHRAFREVAAESIVMTEPISVVNVLPTSPRPDLGGVQVQMLRRLRAEAEERPWALLYPDGGGYCLEIEAEGEKRAVPFPAPPPARPPELVDRHFEKTVEKAAGLVGAGIVHFEQVPGWPLESVARLRETGRRLVISVHDFGLFCPRPHLLERPEMRFCGYSRDPERCLRCLRRDWRVDEGFQDRRRAVAGELLKTADAVIFASDFLRRTYAELFPNSAPERHVVVEPPSFGSAAATARGEVRPTGRHVAYVGSVQPHKGALLFEQLVDLMAGCGIEGLRWSVYGGGDAEILTRLRRRPAVRVRGYYRADELPGMLRRDRVDLALLLSIWPEAYALTLDECLRAGVPVLAFEHGAVADRVRRLGGGELVAPEAGAEGVVEKLERMLERVPTASVPESGLPDADTAAQAVGEIYEDLEPRARRAFHGGA
ncbi:MAG: glycosyltransferase family 4 protein [bacterium]|nr:glycosyltransferase family 4 protein [bacterium]